MRLPHADRASLAGARRGAGRPDRRPGLASSPTACRGSSTTRTPSSRTCRGGSTTTASTSRSPSRARPRSRRSGARVTEGSGELVSFTRDALHGGDRGLDRADPDRRPVRLHAALRRADRRGGASRRAARATARRTTTTRPASSGRSSATSAASCCSRSSWARAPGVVLWILGSLGVFPEGKTYALVFGAFYGFAELIPYVGPAIGAAPPVLIALFSGEPARRAVADDHVHRRCSRSRATSSRRPSSRRRCGSIRCW